MITYLRTAYTNIVAELKKCTWPTRQELTESTMVVLVSVLLLSLYVWGLDALSGLLVTSLTKAASLLN
jgi:preprotein translocase subunit SecE